MKKKEGNLNVFLITFIFLTLISITPVIATEEEQIDLAYACLEDKLGDDCGNTESTEQIAYSLLAGAYDSGIKSDCRNKLTDSEQDTCWGATASSNCDLKSTAQVILAFDRINKNTDDNIDWIKSKKQLVKNLNWFLEIDTNELSTCKISENEGSEKSFEIKENKKISGTSSCLTPAEGNYFLKISDNCLDKNFTISCDKDFISTLIYKKSGDSTYHVSSNTHSAPSEGQTKEVVNSYCFGTSNNCDYEGSLWATIALAKVGEDISSYLPFLGAESTESANKKFFPAVFLYMLTGQDDFYLDIIEKQKQNKYWSESKNKYHDTALTLLALENFITQEVTDARTYLLTIQEESGCWNSGNLRDTSLILYSSWRRTVSVGSSGTSGTSGTGETSRADCQSSSYSCISSSECSISDTLDNFYCSGLSDICCKNAPLELSCNEKDGIICEFDQECTASETFAADTSYCCLGSCIVVEAVDMCEDFDGTCQSSCSEGESEKPYQCDFGDVCCKKDVVSKSSGGWGVIIILFILIILISVAIIYRNKLKIWWFKNKSKLTFKKGPSPTNRPNSPPPGSFPIPDFTRPPARSPSVARSDPRRAPPRRVSRKADPLDDTMRKLKKMSG